MKENIFIFLEFPIDPIMVFDGWAGGQDNTLIVRDLLSNDFCKTSILKKEKKEKKKKSFNFKI